MDNIVGSVPEQILAGLEGKIGTVAAGLEDAAAAYVEVARASASRLAHREADPADSRAALEELERMAALDVDAPTVSRRPAVRWVKGSVKQLSAWYLRYLAQQVTAFADASVRVGWALTARADALEQADAALRAEVAELRERVERLERGSGQAGG